MNWKKILDTALVSLWVPLKRRIQDRHVFEQSIFDILDKKLDKLSLNYEKDLANCKQFFEQNLNRRASRDDLIVDLFDTLLYPQDDKYSHTMRMLVHYLNYTTVISKESKKVIEDSLLHTKEGGNTIYIVNHRTYVNPWLLCMELIQSNIIPSHDIKTHTYVPIWPFAATNKSYRHGLQWISNIYKVYPTTKNGIISWLERAQQAHNIRYVRELQKNFSSQPKEETIWNILIVAPTGTADTFVMHNGSEQILFGNDDDISCVGTFKTIESLFNKNPNIKIVLVGMNEWAIIDKSKYYNPWVRNQSIYIEALDITNNFSELYTEKNIMPTLATLIKDKDWLQIGKALPPEELVKKKN